MDKKVDITITTIPPTTNSSETNERIPEKGNSEAKLVSIRCRRHKKRFNVPAEWIQTSKWLCPKCHAKLSPEERERYAPNDMETVEVRAFDVAYPTIGIGGEGKKKPAPVAKQNLAGGGSSQLNAVSTASIAPIPKPTKKEVSASDIEMDCIYCGTKQRVPKAYYYGDHLFCPNCAKNLGQGEKERFQQSFMIVHLRRYREIEARYREIVQAEPDKEAVQRAKRRQEFLEALPKREPENKPIARQETAKTASRTFISDDLSALLPDYRITCKKCGQTVPCFKMWFNNSKVLCPSCFAGMNSYEVECFHKAHPDSEARITQVASRRPLPSFSHAPTRSSAAADVSRLPIRSPDNWASQGGGWGNDSIMHASEKDLMRAVNEGLVSRARARIELNRRKKAAYYNDLPDTDVAIVSV